MILLFSLLVICMFKFCFPLYQSSGCPAGLMELVVTCFSFKNEIVCVHVIQYMFSFNCSITSIIQFSVSLIVDLWI